MKAGDVLKPLGNLKFIPDWFNHEVEISDHTISVHHQIKCLPADITKPNNIIPYSFYDSKNVPVTAANHFRGHDENDFEFVDNRHKDAEIRQKLTGKSLYLGWLFSHYGHFLTESLSRLWVIEEVDFQGFDYFLFNYKQNKKGDILKAQFIWDTLAKLGINKEKVVLIDDCYTIEELHIPTQALVLRSGVSKKMNSVWSQVSKPNAHPHLKTYISRTEIPRRSLQNEIDLQNALKEKGFKVIAPQNMSFEDQLAIYANTKLLVSPAGTGLHNAVFMPKNTRIISITHEDFLLINELLCCYASEVDYQVYLTESVQTDGQWNVDVKDFLAYL